jgi:hypothetical protein
MALSRELRELLKLLREYEVSVDFCIEQVREIGEEMAPEPEQRERIRREYADLSVVFAKLVKSRREPTLDFPEDADQVLRRFLGHDYVDDKLDEVLTCEAIDSIAGAVSRWKMLQTLGVSLAPHADVRMRMHQATTCFIWGLYDATAILCRASIEFSIQVLLERAGGLHFTGAGSSDYLRRLIELAERARLLTAPLAKAAHDVRKVGNSAAHKAICRKADAVRCLEATARIIRHVYGSGSHHPQASA